MAPKFRRRSRVSITWDPKKMLKEIAPEAKIKRLVTRNLTLKKTALSFVDAAADDGLGVLNKKAVGKIALKTIKGYRERIAAEAVSESGEVIDAARAAAAADALEASILADPKQLIQRVQNELVFQISKGIRDQYSGEKYEWLPSDAEEPDPEHQLNYGKVFTIGEGEMPGERIGCRCGMEILVKQTELQLE